MAIWNNNKITDSGLLLITRARAEQKALLFTTLKTSSYNYSSVDIAKLTNMEEIKQEFAVSELVQEEATTKISTNLTNDTLLERYDLYSYGVYGKIEGDEEETLILMSATEVPDIVPSTNEAQYQSLINSYIPTATDLQLTIEINPAANATQQYVENKIIENKLSMVSATIDESGVITEGEELNKISKILVAIDNGTAPTNLDTGASLETYE